MSYALITRRKRISVEKMRWHIRLLCKEARIERRWCRRGNEHIFDGRGAEGTIAVYLPPIRGVVEYAIALHELGHFYGRYQLPRYAGDCQEWWAWVWARENALVWTRMMFRTAIRGLASYV
jgi:hypothetical protein